MKYSYFYEYAKKPFTLDNNIHYFLVFLYLIFTYLLFFSSDLNYIKIGQHLLKCIVQDRFGHWVCDVSMYFIKRGSWLVRVI